MARLSTGDLVALLHVVDDLYDCVDVSTFAARVVRAARTLIPGEVTTYSDIDLARGVPIEASDQPALLECAARERFAEYMHEHPLIAHYARTGDGRARKISDLVTRRQLHRTPLYNEYVRPFCGTEHQIAIAIRAGRSRVIGLSMARSGRDYSERDRLLLDLLRPHLVRAAASTSLVAQLTDALMTPFTRSEDSAVEGLVAIDRAGRTRLMTTRARRLLETYVGRVPAGDRLPDAVRAWVHAHQRGHRSGDAPGPFDPLEIRGERGTLTIRPRPTPEGLVLLMEAQSTDAAAACVSRARLTPRETEVLTWVAEGKTSAEIAKIIGVRPRTVDKHLEHIFSKLGVENRTAAAVMLARRPAPTE